MLNNGKNSLSVIVKNRYVCKMVKNRYAVKL